MEVFNQRFPWQDVGPYIQNRGKEFVSKELWVELEVSNKQRDNYGLVMSQILSKNVAWKSAGVRIFRRPKSGRNESFSGKFPFLLVLRQ